MTHSSLRSLTSMLNIFEVSDAEFVNRSAVHLQNAQHRGPSEFHDSPLTSVSVVGPKMITSALHEQVGVIVERTGIESPCPALESTFDSHS